MRPRESAREAPEGPWHPGTSKDSETSGRGRDIAQKGEVLLQYLLT